MARRGKYAYDAHCFKDVIKAIKQDLGISKAEVRFSFQPANTYYGTLLTYHHSPNRVMSYRAVIDPTQTKEEITKTLCHELRHCWQFEKRLLKNTFDGHNKWRGKKYKKVNAQKEWDAYEQLPWEIDAREYESKYIDFIHLVKEKA